MKEFIDKTSTTAGTKINRANLMKMQGFENSEVTFSGNQIIEVNGDGETLTTTFNSDGSISEKLEGDKVIETRTVFDGNVVKTNIVGGVYI